MGTVSGSPMDPHPTESLSGLSVGFVAAVDFAL